MKLFFRCGEPHGLRSPTLEFSGSAASRIRHILHINGPCSKAPSRFAKRDSHAALLYSPKYAFNAIFYQRRITWFRTSKVGVGPQTLRDSGEICQNHFTCSGCIDSGVVRDLAFFELLKSLENRSH